MAAHVGVQGLLPRGGGHHDPGAFVWPDFLARVHYHLNGDDMPLPDIDSIDLILDQLAGPVRPDGTRGWAQLGGRSVVDALAAIGENLGISGFRPPPTV